MTDAELVTEALRVSGLSVARFAADVLAGRDERTVRRWRSGQQAMPPKARAYLEAWLAERTTNQRGTE